MNFAPMTAGGPQPTNAPAARWRVLLVDDEPTQRLIMARILRRAGYEVDTASNGREALAKIESSDFHLMITDWEMPEMDGIALCSAVRASPREGYIYTILLTARDTVDHVVTGLNAGADDYLTKPVIEPELIARLNTGQRIVTLERSLRAVNEANRRLSITDSLTGTYNRRYLMEQLPREIERAARYGRALSVIMCDVDYFKRVNDTHGHLVGDELLRAFAARVQSSSRACDWLARYGGEEFVVVLPETNLANAQSAAENLRMQVVAAPLQLASGAMLPITASFGVAGWRNTVPMNATVDALMARCDAGVYASKAAGRNRVTVEPMD